jgi:hypothetical protein
MELKQKLGDGLSAFGLIGMLSCLDKAQLNPGEFRGQIPDYEFFLGTNEVEGRSLKNIEIASTNKGDLPNFVYATKLI